MGRRVPKIVHDIRYIRGRARGVMGRLKIRSDSYREYGEVTSIARAIATSPGIVIGIRRRLFQLGEPAWGRIAAMGKGCQTCPDSLEEFPFLKDCAPAVLTGGWISEDDSGRTLLLTIALASLIGAMAVNINEDLQKEFELLQAHPNSL